VRKHYEEFDTEIRYFAKTVDFLAANKTTDLLGVELTLTSLENLISPVALPHRAGVAADGRFHPMLSLQVVTLGDSPAFSYIFRRVEAPGREHVPLRVEREAGDDYDIEIRYFSNRIEFYAKNKTRRLLMGSLDFPSLKNLSLKEKSPVRVRLPADGKARYLATLVIPRPMKGYSFTYRVGPGKEG
jgi:hypothetical protein